MEQVLPVHNMPPNDAPSTGDANRKFFQWPAKDRLFLLLKIVLAISLFAFLATHTDITTILGLCVRIRWPWFVGMLFSLGATVWFTALRYRVLIGRNCSFGSFLRIVIYQNATSIFIAAAAGIASYVALVYAKHGVKPRRGVASVAVAKIADLFCLGLILLSSFLAVAGSVPGFGPTVVTLAVVTSVLSVGSIVLWYAPRTKFWAAASQSSGPVLRFLIPRGVAALIDELLRSDPLSAKEFARFASYSLLVNLFSFAGFYCNMKMFSVAAGCAPVVFVSAIMQLVGVIPIHVFGGLGVCDIPSMYLYGLFGVPKGDIAAVLIGSRIVVYAIYGVVLLVVMAIPSGREFVESRRTAESAPTGDTQG